MASFQGLAAVGKSVVDLLNTSFSQLQPISEERPATAALVTTDDFDRDEEGTSIPSDGVSIFVYRADWNRATRAAWSSVASVEGRSQLPLDLHFLLTPWSKNATDELRILGRALQCLEDAPILTGPLLDALGGWNPGEAVQLALADVTTEDILRVFDSLPHDYKLSVPYVARVVRLSGKEARTAPEVVTAGTRMGAKVP